MDVMYKLIFIHNPHDIRSVNILECLLKAEIADEKHIIDVEKAKTVLPIQDAPCVFLLGTSELLTEFDSALVIDNLKFMKMKKEVEQVVENMTDLLFKEKDFTTEELDEKKLRVYKFLLDTNKLVIADIPEPYKTTLTT